MSISEMSQGTPGPLPWDGADGFLSLVRQPGPGAIDKSVALVVIAIEKGATESAECWIQRQTTRDHSSHWTEVVCSSWIITIQNRVQVPYWNDELW